MCLLFISWCGCLIPCGCVVVWQYRDVPDYLCGKISFELLSDPVITPSGITYPLMSGWEGFGRWLYTYMVNKH